MSTGSTVLPRPTGNASDPTDFTGEARAYRITQSPIVVPGKRPKVVCHGRYRSWLCTRPVWHSGRCAAIHWQMGGHVRAVWGFRPDVSRARKVSTDEVRARLEAGVSA